MEVVRHSAPIRGNARGLTTKRAVAAELAHHGSGYVLAGAVTAGAILRCRGPRLGWVDLRAAAAVAGLQPLVEWGLHRYALHGPAITIGGRVVDPGAAHRGHHRIPDDVAGALLGTPFALSNGAVVAAIAALVGRVAGGRAAIGTAVAAGEAGLLTYEWTHLLSHSGYRPRTAWFRRLRASHLRHHFRDESVNFGVTSSLVDRALGTYARGHGERPRAPAQG
jgi:hypothetical protein